MQSSADCCQGGVCPHKSEGNTESGGTPATITGTGGRFTSDTTGAGGRTLAAAVSWTCP
jgi:hypothetical protein